MTNGNSIVSKPGKFSSIQLKIIWVCIACYTVAYFCRLNLSAALNAVITDFGLTKAQGGVLATVFAAVYACGQLVNGSIVNRVNPMKHMLTGLLGSAVCNTVMGLSGRYEWLLVCCFGNAVFQSMMWTPIMRMTAVFFENKKQLGVANKMISYSLVVGHFGAWLISGMMAEKVNWHLSFIIPAVLAFITVIVSYFICGKVKLPEPAADAGKKASGGKQMLGVLYGTGFFYIMLASVIFGFVRDSNVTWAPTILNDLSQGLNISSATVSLLLPLVNLLGVALGFLMKDHGLNPHLVVALMLACVIVFAVLLPMFTGVIAVAAMLSLVCAAMSAANPMLSSVIPLSYHFVNATGLTAGLLDSTVYLGSALAGVIGGSMMDAGGTSALYTAWMIVAAAGAAVALLASRMMKNWQSKQS